MNENQKLHWEPADADAKRIEAAMQRGVRQALWEHKQLGHHIIVWRDGKIVRLPPEEINVEKPAAP
jgi:hypothetical protein